MRVFLRSLAGLALAFVTSSASAAPLYHLIATVPLGGGIKWDYLHDDAASHRVFISHGNEVTVVDTNTAKIIGQLANLPGSHGVSVDPASHLIYADSAARGLVVAFDPKTLGPVASAPVIADADGISYDPASRQMFVSGGDGNGFTPVSTITNKPAPNINLGTTPEFHVADGQGSVYVDLVDNNAIARIDSRANKIIATWPVAPCMHPKGLAIDPATRRLFASCANRISVVVDADTGHVLASFPIGAGTDAAGFDPLHKRFLAPAGDGTLSVIAELGADHFSLLGTVITAPGARTMAVDPATGRVFLVTAAVTKTTPPANPGDHPHYIFAPGSLKLLIFAPAG